MKEIKSKTSSAEKNAGSLVRNYGETGWFITRNDISSVKGAAFTDT